MIQLEIRMAVRGAWYVLRRSVADIDATAAAATVDRFLASAREPMVEHLQSHMDDPAPPVCSACGHDVAAADPLNA